MPNLTTSSAGALSAGLRTAASIGVLEMFKIGVGPSSSHTMGPMLAAREFMCQLAAQTPPGAAWHLTVELYGSLAATGRGHRTDEAVSAGLLGLDAAQSPIEEIWGAHGRLNTAGQFTNAGAEILYRPDADLKWNGFKLDGQPLKHPNTIRFSARRNGETFTRIARSIGGGFIEFDDPAPQNGNAPSTPQPATRNPQPDLPALPYPFNSAEELIAHCEQNNISLVQLAFANEQARGHEEAPLRARLAEIWEVMQASIERGLHTEGILPGGLNVRRRAASLQKQIDAGKFAGERGMRLSAYAMAVNEENAAGGRVVTAPTNGASGLLPAVFRELHTMRGQSIHELENGLLVAGMLGALIKTGASISGAEVGCQGEVGAACAMAAGAATILLGGNPRQVECAAEIAIEHHLGMTCDPVKGLVQIPCIERNAMGANMALNAASLALAGSGNHMVSFDHVLTVMKQTGMDMKTKYKETGSGGLGVG